MWALLAFIDQLKWTVSSWQNPQYGGSATIGDYKQTVESNVAITYRLSEMFAFGTGLMQPILAEAQPPITLAGDVALNEVDRQPYDIDKLCTGVLVWMINCKGWFGRTFYHRLTAVSIHKHG